MSKILFLIVLALSFHGLSAERINLITKKQVGKLKIDNNIESVYSSYKFENTKLVDLYLEGSLLNSDINKQMDMDAPKSGMQKLMMVGKLSQAMLVRYNHNEGGPLR